ncbi:nucleosome assembly protein 1-like 1 [Strigomonas culicis]|uniref:Nucleosome assembly protein 1-like 1 n=1 Tax=Strigomonas culicis TaxID=28005 RepID=S9W5Y2_9TRYP|nr:nucleosome assembly protein 1-like 1 [Strigomonas culicis]EPY33426.1 nucleosome assembly protein 1-like 1 [Strigomonas culicis]EPY34606.1 nucleosome assembly protein 1-like 1 [Strigomonas culicis]|eukprot:EPY20230.1 nucleosome assembly protein 1-like 1 [Strigomonas culicis]
MPPKQHPPARHVDPIPDAAPSEDSADHDEEVDLLEVMRDMPLHERRSVYALKGLVEDFKVQRRALMAQLQAAERQYKAKEAALLERRRQIVSGALEVTAEDVSAARADLQRREAEDAAKKGAPAAAEAAPKKKGVTVLSEEEKAQKKRLEAAAANPAGGIPGFWLQALRHGSATDGIITERDEKALLHLQDIQVVMLEGGEGEPQSGSFRIDFHFGANEFFKNKVLTKTYHMVFDENDESEHVAKIDGCTIDWTSSKNNLTVTVKQKKQRNKNTKQIRVIEKEEPTDSFFNFFKAPKLSLDDDDSDEEDEEEDEGLMEQEFEMDIEIAQHITEDLVPHAAYFFSGKSVDDVALELMKQYGGMDDEEEEEEEEEEDAGEGAFSQMVASRGRGGRGGAAGNSGARGGRGGAGQQQECKQQ